LVEKAENLKRQKKPFRESSSLDLTALGFNEANQKKQIEGLMYKIPLDVGCTFCSCRKNSKIF